MSNEVGQNNQEQEQSQVIYTPDMIANMSLEELEKNADVIEKQLNSFGSDEEYNQAIQPNNEPVQTEENTEVSTENTGSEESPKEEDKENKPMTPEEFMEFLTSPFRASHREISITDPNDIRRLMQQGFDYQKKMAEFKPQRKVIKTLEKHGLLDESKLNFAIELMNGKPEAIAKLLKDREIDTFALPDLEEKPYEVANYMVNTTQVDFEETVKELQQTPQGHKVLHLLNNVNDANFQEVYNSPELMAELINQANIGLMEDALNQLDTDLALGKVPSDMSYLDAYKAISTHIYQNNKEKYSPQIQRKVVGNNVQQTTQTKPDNRQFASIPTNQQVTQTGSVDLSEADIAHLVANTSAEEISKYGSWEEFLAKNQMKFQ